MPGSACPPLTQQDLGPNSHEDHVDRAWEIWPSPFRYCQMLALSSFCHPISYTLNRHLDHHLGQTLICTSLKEGHGETSVWCWFQQSLLSQDLRGWGG